MKFLELESGCYVPISHKLNADGYFRFTWEISGTTKRLAEFFHRTMWKHHNGEMPDGYEIDHMCGVRSCCNINHLRCIPKKEHKVHTNSTRYAHIKAAAKEYWMRTMCKGTELALSFDRSPHTACDWIKTWKDELGIPNTRRRKSFPPSSEASLAF